jgi:ABC-type transport system involved in multi-copper enzyme maturation permease subunit
MTDTITPYRSETKPGRADFPSLVRAEWTKFRTVRGWTVGALVAVLVMMALGLVATSASTPQGGRAEALATGPGGEAVNDSLYLVHQRLSGDGSITVPVTSLTGRVDFAGTARDRVQSWAKAGLIVKKDLTQGSSYAAVMVTGAHGVRMQYDYTHDTAGMRGAVTASTPRWLRLVRAGDTITTYDSADGTRWSKIGSARPAGLPGTVQVGLFVTSPQNMEAATPGATMDPATATAAFGAAAFDGQWSSGAWKGEQLGRAGTSGSYSPRLPEAGYTEEQGGFTVTGAGDIAPVVGGPALGNGFSIENFLVGTFAGAIAMMVVATMFVTSEYRRGLIRTTLTASPRRGRVLVAKALVIGSVAFVAGLLAAAFMVKVGEPRARDNGFHVFPVQGATELRVIVGTALLLAVAAVLALAVGALLRRSAAAIAGVVVLLVLPYVLAIVSVLPDGASNWLLRITPAAGFAIQQTVPRYDFVANVYTPSTGYYPLPPWAGLAVLCGWAAFALAAAGVLLRRRDAA